jgi:hypothetical protein
VVRLSPATTLFCHDRPSNFFTIKKANTPQKIAHFNALGATIDITILVFFKAIK